MSNKHTPGPWFAEDLTEGTDQEFIGVSSDNVNNIADVWAIDTTQEQCQANARLIAAAPELLGASRAARDVLATAIRANWEGATDDDIAEHVTIKRLDIAIAKATGADHG